jgi:hypothetical protein
MFRRRETFLTSAGSRRSVSRPTSSLQPNYYIEYVIAASAFFGKRNLNLILCSLCSSEVMWSALSNLLKEYSIILLSVKWNLSQKLLLRINLMFWWSSAERSYSCPKTLNKNVQSRENVHTLHRRRTSHSRELAASQQRFPIMILI